MNKPKKKSRKAANVTLTQPSKSKAASFGFEEILSELESIVAEAEVRRREEETA